MLGMFDYSSVRDREYKKQLYGATELKVTKKKQRKENSSKNVLITWRRKIMSETDVLPRAVGYVCAEIRWEEFLAGLSFNQAGLVNNRGSERGNKGVSQAED